MANVGELARQAFDDWMEGTGNFADLFSPDMTWEIVGHSAASAKYSTAQEFQDKVLAPFAQRFKPEEPFRPVKICAGSTSMGTPSSHSGTVPAPRSSGPSTRTPTCGS